MTQLQANFQALADGDSGAPDGDRLIDGRVSFDGTGGSPQTIRDSYNVIAVTSSSTGAYTIEWDINFANDDFAIAGSSAATGVIFIFSGNTTGTTLVSTQTSAGTLVDTNFVLVIASGDR